MGTHSSAGDDELIGCEADCGCEPAPTAFAAPEPRRCRGWRTILFLGIALGCVGFAGFRYRALLAREDFLLGRSAELSGVAGARLNFDKLAVPRESILAGGPPKDGIPALTTLDAAPEEIRRANLHGSRPPSVVAAAQADLPDPQTRVVGVVLGGQARAYPMSVLNWHECVNDVVGKIPIAIVYCPLCDSVAILDRRLDGKVYEFGISGLLYNSNVLLYDRTDQALWSQIGMEAVSGPNVGRSLVHLDGWEITALDRWVQSHPDTEVLTFDTGFDREYEKNPYDFYFGHDEIAFPIDHVDARLNAKHRIVGVRWGERFRAYPLSAILQAPSGVLRDRLGPDQEMVLAATAEGGVRIEHIPAGAAALHTFWYAWAAMHPQTELYEAPQP